MLDLLKHKILEANNLEYLQKLSNILQIAIKDKMRNISPSPLEMYHILDKVHHIVNLDYSGNSKKEILETQKKGFINSIDELNSFMNTNKLNQSIDELLFGKKATEQRTLIDFSLLMVEQNNIEYFLKRPSIFETEPHDRLAYHYVIIYEHGMIKFDFLEKSELPDYICQEASSELRSTIENFLK